MRFLGTIIVAVATLFGLELGMQARTGFPFQLTTASPSQCKYLPHKDKQLGYLTKKLASLPPSAKPELMVLGDSIVAGHGFEDFEDSLGPRLERSLASKGLDVTVRSLGVAGYNLSQQLRLLELELMKKRSVKPHGVLLTLNAGDADAPLSLTAQCRLIDPTTTSGSKMSLQAALRLESIRQLIIAKTIPIINRFGISSYFGPQLIGALKPRLTSPRWQEAATDLRRVTGLMDRLGVPVAMVIFPYSAELSVPVDKNPLVAFLTDFTATAELPALVVLDSISDLSPHEAYLEGNALHLNTRSLDRFLPKLTTLVLGFK